jgi:hypothetical protein
MTVEVFGQNYENGLVTISYVHDEKEPLVAQQAGPLAVGQSILIYPTSSLHLPFEVKRTSCHYEFNYRNPQTDGIRWSGFNSNDAGYEPHLGKDNPKLAAGQYCYTTIMPSDPRGPAKKIMCSFPAW